MSIDVNHAELHTATVELKMITVNQRQMTLSVFRQIPERRLIDGETMKLNGVPWGWVNYFWPDVKIPFNAKGAVQVVWQKDATLYRSVIMPLRRRLWLDCDSHWQKHIPSAIEKALDNLSNVRRDALKEWRKDHPFGQRSEEESTPAETQAKEAVWSLVQAYNTIVKNLTNMDQLFIAVGGGGRPR